MSFTHTLVRAYRDSSGNSLTSQEAVVSDSEGNFSGGVASGQTAFEIDLVLRRSTLQSLCVSASLAITIKTNGTGSAGAITATTLNTSGSGYAVGDTGTISGGTAGTYLVTGIGASGAVTAYTTAGTTSGYAISSAVVTATGGGQAGSGTGFKVNITGIVEILTLVTGQVLVWSLNTDGLGKLPFTSDVSKFFVANAGGSTAQLDVRSLQSV